MKKEEEEIARLEAQARGEELKRMNPMAKDLTTEVQTKDSAKQEEADTKAEAQEDT